MGPQPVAGGSGLSLSADAAESWGPQPSVADVALRTDYGLGGEGVRLGGYVADRGPVESDGLALDDRSLLNAAERGANPRDYVSVEGTARVARAGDNISRFVGSSDPQAVGNFMRANGLTSSRIEAGRNYFVPDDVSAYGDSDALGQTVLNADNVRLAALAQQRAAQQQAYWDSLQAGAWSGRTGEGGPVWHVSGPQELNAVATLSGLQRAQAHVLGVYDAGAGVVEAAGYSYGVTGTPESRAAWAVKTAEATVEGVRRFFNDPAQAVSAWWSNLTGDDPAAIRLATAQGAGIALGATGGIATGRLQGGLRVGAATEGMADGVRWTAQWLAPQLDSLTEGYMARTVGILYAGPPSPRVMPGVVTFGNNLVEASGNWLKPDVATPIPLQVARQLDGKSFNTFGELRSAVWESIGNNPDLNATFRQKSFNELQAGRAPFAPPAFQNEQFGLKFNLHHVDPIAAGGAVYDLSNLHIVSPVVHSSLHTK